MSERLGTNAETENCEALTYAIIGAAIEVHRHLRSGHMESVYEAALCIELDNRGLSYVRQKALTVNYKGHQIGSFIADLIVENRVIVELKAVKELAAVHEAQLIGYLTMADLQFGLLINFNVAVLKQGIRRIAV